MIGSRIGPYEILSTLGEGGMGVVYRAADSNLKRHVAIKVLPQAFASDPDRLARFQREAELLATLNHPNIAQIYGVEKTAGALALVMELVEGPTLAERMMKGAIPIDEALPLAKQIADGLEAAHERGIIHRDLKPANIKVRDDGVVKVLDFGLATALDRSGKSGGSGRAGGSAGVDRPDLPDRPDRHVLSASPTLTSPVGVTGVGVILGTAAYMSPEQAKGRVVDARADLWAFGSVLFEMLAGARAISGDDVSETYASVVKGDVDWSRLPPTTPPAIRTLLMRCLRKDPRQRLASAGAARLELEEAITAPQPAAERVRVTRASVPVMVAVPVGIAAVAAALWFGGSVGPTRIATGARSLARLSIPLPSGTELAEGASLAISPDGTQVAFTANRSGIRDLYLRRLDAPEAVLMANTRGAGAPFFSPDGKWIAFVADEKLKKVSTTNGVVVQVADVAGGVSSSSSGTWSTDGIIAFSGATGTMTVPEGGGEARPLGSSEPFSTIDRFPEFLPRSDMVLVSANRLNAPTADSASADVVNLATGTRKVLVQGATLARYLPTGHLVFLRDGVLRAVRLDASSLEATGTPTEVLREVRQQQFTGSGAFSCASNGTCVYAAGGTATSRTVVIVDRDGNPQSLPVPPKSYMQPRFSPTGDRIAWWVEQFLCDIEVFDVARGALTRLTSDSDNHYPTWTRDGRYVTYASRKASPGSYAIVARPANGGGTEISPLARPITGLGPNVSMTWSPAGILAFAQRGDIWIAGATDTSERSLFFTSPFVEQTPAFSPDGRWLAYTSDESGRFEVYVRPYPGPGEKYAISTGGGQEPVWSRDGRELFFRNGDQMLSVTLTTTPAFAATRPRLLFTGYYVRGGVTDRTNYDVAPDGEHFVMLQSGEQPATQINVLVNFFDELNRLVPAQ